MLSVTGATARVCECSAFGRHKLPVIALGAERQLEDTVGFVIANFTIGLSFHKRIEIFATRANHKLADSIL